MDKNSLIAEVLKIYDKYENKDFHKIAAELQVLKNQVQKEKTQTACFRQSNVWDNHGKKETCKIGFLDAMIHKISIKSTAGLGYNTKVVTNVSKKLEEDYEWFAWIIGNNSYSYHISMKIKLASFNVL
jgi:hypothetical protein